MRSNRGPASVAVVVLLASLAVSCSSTPQDPTILSTSTATSSGGVAITDEMMGRSRGQTALTRVATDPAYGYSKESSVKVGGGFGTGSERTYQYLNALRGPKGEAVHYIRIGTCCPFKSANSPFGDGLLEVYEITYEGAAKPVRLYFNWYDEAELFVPAGLTPAQ